MTPTNDLRFLPRWRQLEETAFSYAERAAQAPSSTERDRLTHLALSAWRAAQDARLRTKQANAQGNEVKLQLRRLPSSAQGNTRLKCGDRRL
jgi:hypothetical protein